MSDKTSQTNTCDACDDEQIIKYIVENNAYNMISGNRLWQEIISDSICSAENDWISLKKYFHNIILLKIQGGTFSFLTEEHINAFVKNTAELELSEGSSNSNYCTLNSEENKKSSENSNQAESIFLTATSENQQSIIETNLKPIDDNDISFSDTSQKDNNLLVKLCNIQDLLNILESDAEKSDSRNNSTGLNLQESVKNVNILEQSDQEKDRGKKTIEVQLGNQEEELGSGDYNEIIESSGEENNRNKSDVEKSDDRNNLAKLSLQETVTNLNILEQSDQEKDRGKKTIEVQLGNQEEELVSGDYNEIIESSGEEINRNKSDAEKSDDRNNLAKLSLQENIKNVNILEQSDQEEDRGSKKIEVQLGNQEEELVSGDYNEIIESSGEEKNRNKSDVEKSDDQNNLAKLSLQENVTAVNILEQSDQEKDRGSKKIEVQLGNQEEELGSGNCNEIIESSGEEKNRNKNDAEKSDDGNNSTELSLQENITNVNLEQSDHEKDKGSKKLEVSSELIDSSGEQSNIKSILNKFSNDEINSVLAVYSPRISDDKVIFVSNINSLMTSDLTSSSSQNNNNSSADNDLNVNNNDFIRLVNYLVDSDNQSINKIPETSKLKNDNRTDFIQFVNLGDGDSQLINPIPGTSKLKNDKIENESKISNNDIEDTITSEDRNVSKQSNICIISNELVVSSSRKLKRHSSKEDIYMDYQPQRKKKVPIYDFKNFKSKYEHLSLFNKSTCDSTTSKEKGKQIITNRNIIKKKSKKTLNSDLKTQSSMGGSINSDAISKNVFCSSTSIRSNDTIFEIESCNSGAGKVNKQNDIDLHVSSNEEDARLTNVRTSTIVHPHLYDSDSHVSSNKEDVHLTNVRTNTIVHPRLYDSDSDAHVSFNEEDSCFSYVRTSIIGHPRLSVSELDTDIEYNTCSEDDCIINKNKQKSKNNKCTESRRDVIVISSDSDDLISTENNNLKRKRVNKNTKRTSPEIDTRRRKIRSEVDDTFCDNNDNQIWTTRLSPIVQQSNCKCKHSCDCSKKQKNPKSSDEFDTPIPHSVNTNRNNENDNIRRRSSTVEVNNSNEERSNFSTQNRQVPKSNVLKSKNEKVKSNNKPHSRYAKFRCLVCKRLHLFVRSTTIKRFYIDCLDCNVRYKCTEDVLGDLTARKCK